MIDSNVLILKNIKSIMTVLQFVETVALSFLQNLKPMPHRQVPKRKHKDLYKAYPYLEKLKLKKLSPQKVKIPTLAAHLIVSAIN